MEELKKVLDECLNEELKWIIISNPKDKNIKSKIKIRPVDKSGTLIFQAEENKDKKAYHNNYGKEEAAEVVLNYIAELFGQLQIETASYSLTVLSSKKGKITIGKKKGREKKENISLEHNRKKRYILEEGKPVPYLIDLGVMGKDGTVIKSKYDKFRQINRFLEFIRDILPKLAKDREIHILDFGCGKSYLTFAMYHYLKELMGYQVRITGLDLKEDVINTCSRLKDKYGYQGLEFQVGDVASYQSSRQIDMVVTLHACDTATDHALYHAVNWGAEVILSVPCCQHEVNGQVDNQILNPLLKYGLIKERMSALITDAIRAEKLREQGYSVQILEFIDMEHTPKNILIRAVKSGKKKKSDELEVMNRFLNVHPAIEQLFEEEGKKTDG